MSLILSGSDGLSDVDGSASTPAIRGTDANTGIFFPAADTIAFAEGGVESARFNSSGNLQLVNSLSVGNATPTTSGAGITFPATQSASSDANTLDDYEEGTWTGTMTGSVSNPTTPVTATGYYTKVGRLVTATIYFGNVNTTGASGSVNITGLPFTSSSNNQSTGSAGSYLFDFPAGLTSLWSAVDGSSTTLVLVVSGDSANWGNLVHLAGTGRYFQATITYFV